MKSVEDIFVSDIKNMTVALQGVDFAFVKTRFPEAKRSVKYEDSKDFEIGYAIGMRQAKKPHLSIVNADKSRKA